MVLNRSYYSKEFSSLQVRVSDLSEFVDSIVSVWTSLGVDVSNYEVSVIKVEEVVDSNL